MRGGVVVEGGKGREGGCVLENFREGEGRRIWRFGLRTRGFKSGLSLPEIAFSALVMKWVARRGRRASLDHRQMSGHGVGLSWVRA
jgi:hypothetical protein